MTPIGATTTALPPLPVLVLVYRAGCAACGSSCWHAKGGGRQYAFESLDALAKWCGRKPYSEEWLTVIVFKNRLQVGRARVPASDSVAFARGVLA